MTVVEGAESSFRYSTPTCVTVAKKTIGQ